jgi:type I restriction enzyme S subunit
MSDHGEKPLMPQLRFPEFQANDGWGTEFGNMIFDQITNKDHNSDLPVLAITQEQGAIPRDMIDYNVSVTDKSLESYKVVEVGDFIISLRSFQGGIEFSRFRGICSPAYVILRLKHGHSEDYFRHYLKTHQFIAKMTKNLEGLRDGKMISYKQFSELALPIPSHREQQNIAECLSSLDELIAAETKKLGALKTHKKGLMQQLFPREDEVLPQLRLPEFVNAGEWKKAKLSTKIDLISGLHLAPDQYSEAGEVPYFTGPSDYTNDLSVVGKWTVRGANTGREGDILVTVKGSGVGELLYLKLDEIAIGRQLMAIRPRSAYGKFLFHSLALQRQRFVALASGNLIPGLSRSDILNLTASFPEQVEQQAIAELLSSLDSLITIQNQKVSALKAHKKALVQKLFPAVDEVST